MRLFHVKLGIMVLIACADPGDAIYEPELAVPREVAPGLVRLTMNPGPDHVRGISADGRVVFLTAGLQGGPSTPGVVSMDPAGGPARLEAGAYSTVLPGVIANDYSERGGRRTLLTMVPPRGRDHYCGEVGFPAPAPTFVGWRLYVLPAVDGPAFSSLSRFERELPFFENAGFTEAGGLRQPKRIRMVPAFLDADSGGTRALGPALTPLGDQAYLSDADSIWRVTLTDSTVSPVAITAGAYPVLSRDGNRLFFARATVTDSVAVSTTVVFGFASCTQFFVTFTVGEWTLFQMDLASGAESPVGSGTDPALVGDTAVIVRRPDGLHLLRLADGVSTRLVDDPTATSPALAPDGSFLAFTSRRFGNPDVLVLRLN